MTTRSNGSKSYGSVNAGRAPEEGSSDHSLEAGQASTEKTDLLGDGNDGCNGTKDNGSWKGGSTKTHGWFRNCLSAENRRRLCWSITLSILAVLLALLLFWAGDVFIWNRPFVEPHDSHLDPLYRQGALSRLDPVADLGMYEYERPLTSQPAVDFSARRIKDNIVNDERTVWPTNAWYQNLLLLDEAPDDDTPPPPPKSLHRAYAMPYVVDAAGPVAGLRVYPQHVMATSRIVQVYVIENHGLTTGLAAAVDGQEEVPKRYQVERMTPLGITISWMHSQMTTTIVKGMPYTTMTYDNLPIVTTDSKGYTQHMYPTVVSEIPILTDYMTIDQTTRWTCTGGPVWVEYELQFYVPSSDFTWLIFVSEPVQIQCTVLHSGQTYLQVVGRKRSSSGGDQSSFVLRTALFMTCTKNTNPSYCHQEQLHPSALHWGQGDYGTILRQHAHLYPGPKSKFSYDFDDTESKAVLEFDWDVQSTNYPHPMASNKTTPVELLTFALPHHWDMERTMRSPSTHQIYCAPVLIGPSCLVEGSVWHLFDSIPSIGLRNPRPPNPVALGNISLSLKKDLQFRVPDYFQRGAGDTYFSGKILAKLGRILVMAEELVEICTNSSQIKYDWGNNLTYTDACAKLSYLPTKAERSEALASLRKSVQVWLDGKAQAPFVYDNSWGGVVSCGCLFEDGNCKNQFPDCPAFEIPGLDFGNAFYNDQHFHYGYHIYAAAVVAHFDHDWGKRFFERVLLLVRNIANPSAEDKYFPVLRHKDPYQGHSWASGIVRPTFSNGRNQESSSESIAAYESVAIYGEVMSGIFQESGDKLKLAAAERIRRVGKYATSSELRSTKRYYHVDRMNPIRTYPMEYSENVIGIMWQTMAQFQTWFGSANYLVYGIQLLPVTAVAEHRDTVEWLKEIYPAMEASCESNPTCTETGWSVQILASLATVGHPELAAERSMELSDDAFTSAGGNGHSLSNTLWYIATRPTVDNPIALKPENKTSEPTSNATDTEKTKHIVTDCYQPSTCTDFVLDTVTDVYTCRQRMQWLMWEVGVTQEEACSRVAREFVIECGACDPHPAESNNTTPGGGPTQATCPPCTERQCRSDLNRCPLAKHSYVCTAGPNTGGCSTTPWQLDTGLCQDCCELTDCPQLSPSDLLTLENGWGDNECPACSPQQCREQNVCPSSGTAPYLCIDGVSSGGCSPRPWNLKNGQCSKCCTVTDGCVQATHIVLQRLHEGKL